MSQRKILRNELIVENNQLWRSWEEYKMKKKKVEQKPLIYKFAEEDQTENLSKGLKAVRICDLSLQG
jgi:hypothetical protein